MANRKSHARFERPRDEDGHFIPMELWTNKEVRDFERAKKNGLLKNPIKKTKIRGKKKSEDIYIHPKSEEGKFIPKDQWTESEKKIASRARKKGQTIAQQLPRDEKGRFLSPTGKKSKKSKKSKKREKVDYPALVHPQDGYSVHQGNVTVVYPPYPPPAPSSVQPIPIYAQKIPGYYVRQEPVAVPESEYEDQQINLFEQPDVIYERDKKTGNLVACVGIDQIRGEVRREHELTRDVFAEQCRPCLTEGYGRLLKNPRRRYPMYYVKRTFKEKVGEALDFIKDNPFLAFVATGALMLVGYALYKAFQTYRMRIFASAGVEIVNDAIYFPGEQTYQITSEDKLWMARSIFGEVNRDPNAWSRADVQRAGAAVLWAFANHYMTVGNKRSIYPSLGSFIQAYSQPVNPAWDQSTDTRCQQSPSMCTTDRLAFRQELRSKPWNMLPPALQNVVLNFTAGRIINPIGTRTDFRAAGTGYAPADPINVSGNVFGTAQNARRRPSQAVA